MIKYLLIGLGMVGRSFLRIMIEQGYFDPDYFFCIDENSDALSFFAELGGNPEHFLCVKITEENYKKLLSSYQDGDYIYDFSCEVKNLDLLKYALLHDLHYISTADSNWDLEDPKWVSVHQHFVDYRRISRHRNKKAYTSIIEFGMNPGLVSCFAKECLRKIVETDDGEYISSRRDKLIRLLDRNQYGIVARKIGLEYIVEVDHDNQEFNVFPEEGCVYSPWNPLSFFHECLSAPEIIFGNWKQFRQFDKVRDCDFFDYYVSLMKHGCDCKETVFSPQGVITGFLIPHEEIFSMSYFFRSGRYKPTSFFVYKPSTLAEHSVTANKQNENPAYFILDQSMWRSGGESVGVILQGKKFHTAYFGNYLDGSALSETATIRQVSASAFAAFLYIKNHPRKGFLFPEEVDEDEIFDSVMEYLGENIFSRCESVKPRFGRVE